MTVGDDTSVGARRVQIEALRRLDGPTRLRMALRMSDDSREITVAGIRHRHPDWTDEDVHRELLRLLLGRELAAAVAQRRPDR
jgi:hypothetical protein